ncbi:protein RCC2 homolog [Oratosquilla oratoria]|uniref:protein RCC2 homolog n=1 Tax=Oratosquilla oratoria TaxID=337810 RepID=UPI003F7678BD
MTPEKRPVEDEEGEQEAKKVKADESSSSSTITETVQDENSQDSVTSDTGSASGEKKLPMPEEKGVLVFAGCSQWEYIGRRNLKVLPAKQHYTPCLIGGLGDIRVAMVASHCSAAHSVCVTSEGKVFTFGRNEKGQLGVGDCEPKTGIQMVETLNEFTIISAAVGRNHSLFLTDRGTVFSCGDNKSGQCGVGNSNAIINTPCRISFKDAKIKKVACGGEFSVILDTNGYLYSFGLPEYGQLGHNTDGKYFLTSTKLTYHFEVAPRRIPIFVERGKDGHPTPVTNVQIIDVACGMNHTVAVDSQKRCYSWGFGGYGRLGHAEQKDEYIPRIIKFFDGPNRGILRVFCGATFTVGLGEQGVFLWGQTKRTGEANMYPKPVQDLYGWDVRSVGCSTTSVVVAADDSVISWGPSPTYGELGLGENTKSSTQPKEVKALEGAHICFVSCGMGYTTLVVRNENDKDKEIINKLKEVYL